MFYKIMPVSLVLVLLAGSALAQMPPTAATTPLTTPVVAVQTPVMTAPTTAAAPAAAPTMASVPVQNTTLYFWFGNDRIKEVTNMIRAGRNIEALALLDQVLQRDVRLTEAHLLKGVAYLQMKDYDRAATAFNTILTIDRGYLGAYIYLGQIAIEKKDLKQGQVYLQAIKAVCQTEDCAEFRYLKNALRMAGGEPEQAPTNNGVPTIP